MEVTTQNMIVVLVCFSMVYYASLAAYRLYFSPLAKFPGPKLAASTLWVEFYYDVIKRGRYTWKIVEMHEKYGPIVRISPHELHINDPDYYDELYVGSSRRTMKYEWATKGFGKTLSTQTTASHELHRTRRSAVAPFFSKASVNQLEPVVQSLVDKIVLRLEELRGSGTVVDLVNVYTSLAADTIIQYAFAKPYGFIDSPDFAPYWHKLVMDASKMTHTFRQFGWMQPIMRSIPLWIVTMLNPQLGALSSIGSLVRTQIIEAKAELAEGRKPVGQKTIFYDLLTNDQLRPEDKTLERLSHEGASIFGAGSMTVTLALTVISYHVIEDKEILGKLQTELEHAIPRLDAKPTWNQLEKLPYLAAVIQEGLRWGYGVPHRLQRISPDVALQFNEWSIPPGTPVGMTSVLMHDNPKLFPNPRKFSPERWLQPSSAELKKYMVAFTRGSRNCIGMNLAYCELYLTIAAIFAPGRFNFDLFETDARDIEIAHDFLNASFPLDSKGIRVLVN